MKSAVCNVSALTTDNTEVVISTGFTTLLKKVIIFPFYTPVPANVILDISPFSVITTNVQPDSINVALSVFENKQ
jgi:hypothetical protein